MRCDRAARSFVKHCFTESTVGLPYSPASSSFVYSVIRTPYVARIGRIRAAVLFGPRRTRNERNHSTGFPAECSSVHDWRGYGRGTLTPVARSMIRRTTVTRKGKKLAARNATIRAKTIGTSVKCS